MGLSLTWAELLIGAVGTVPVAVTDSGWGQALPVGALEVPRGADAAALVAEVAAVIVAIAAVRVRHTPAQCAAELTRTAARAAACSDGSCQGPHTMGLRPPGAGGSGPLTMQNSQPGMGAQGPLCHETQLPG